MRWKTTFALLLATLGIGAYLSVYEIRQPSPEERQHTSKYILNVSTDSVTQLAVDLPQAKVTLTRQGVVWRLAPSHLRADPGLISNILSQLTPLVAQRTLTSSSAHPLQLKDFGLDPAVGWVTVVAKGTPTTLLLGEKTAVKNSRYVKVSSRPEIFVISARLFEMANQPMEKFRDPLLMRFDTWLADGLSITSSSSTFSLIRSDNAWRLTRPFADRADRSEVSGLLSRLAGLAIKRVIDEHPQVEQLSAWGLDRPTAEISFLQHQDPQISTTLFFGKPLSDDASLLYAKRNDEAPLYAVAAADVESLLKEPQSLRAKTCFDYFTSNVMKLEVGRGNSTWMIERTKTAWRQARTNTILETDRVEAFLSKLSDLRISGFVGEAPIDLTRYGLQPPVGTITVWATDQPEPQRLFIGAPIGGSHTRYGRIEGRPVIVQLPEAVTELLATGPDQFQPSITTPSASSPATTPHPQTK